MNMLGPDIALEYVDLQSVEGAFEALSDDPQIVMKIPEPLRQGWYYAVLEMHGDAARNARMYLDLGDGFSEAHSVTLLPTDQLGKFESWFFLPKETLLLRFDPCDTKGKFELVSLEIRKLTPAQLNWKRSKHAVGLARYDAGKLWRQFPEYVRFIRKPHFCQVFPPAVSIGGRAYDTWMSRYDFVPQRDSDRIQAQLGAMIDKPLISVVMPTYNTPSRLLEEAIASVRRQIYPNWELCIADDCSTMRHVRRILRKWERRDPRIKVVYREKNGHISYATNSAFEIAKGEWIALLDHDDILREHALAEVALEIERHPGTQLLYSDEDKLDAKGVRYDPFFKPEFSRELFRSQNYLNHLTVHRAENIRQVGGWRPGFEGSQDYDLNLRIFERIDPNTIRHIPKILYHWRATEGSTAVSGSEKSYAWQAGFKALSEHVERIQLSATVEEAPETPFYRVRMHIPEPAPLVSLIIPTRDKIDLLIGCIGTIREKTSYENYEILIIDNGSQEQATLDYFKAVKKEKNIRVLRYNQPFNYSAINNFAVSRAKGSIIGLINNDIEVISPGWLTEMVSWAIRPDVGCVGAKLYYTDDRIQHAGVIVGLGGVAGHSHKFFPRTHPGYFFRLKILQNLSSVTAACLLVRKSVYNEVNGLNEKDLRVAFNDVDFCLKVAEAGYLNVWSPYAELYHLESVSRGTEDSPERIQRFKSEISYMMYRWGDRLKTDPFYSPNLSKDAENFSISS
ncbi:glycosyltransferase family 2 protein [Agrobacterium rhizogenes]|uniref:glycosyltransferase family 2 protein n=1 Tax=Rhizobium rhizogenes TaxID=359 RepID=UPI001574505B|nr:glycosyltransferase family 2 protein [Rhizobium rhizogenes]NTG51398.1 glycosyltransferase family 2 protein [Rhizobium rhizogenes]